MKIETVEDLLGAAAEVWRRGIPQGSATEFNLINPPHAHQFLMFVGGFEAALEYIKRYAAHRKVQFGYTPTDPLLLDIFQEIDSLSTLPTRAEITTPANPNTQEREPT